MEEHKHSLSAAELRELVRANRERARQLCDTAGRLQEKAQRVLAVSARLGDRAAGGKTFVEMERAGEVMMDEPTLQLDPRAGERAEQGAASTPANPWSLAELAWEQAQVAYCRARVDVQEAMVAWASAELIWENAQAAWDQAHAAWAEAQRAWGLAMEEQLEAEEAWERAKGAWERAQRNEVEHLLQLGLTPPLSPADDSPN